MRSNNRFLLNAARSLTGVIVLSVLFALVSNVAYAGTYKWHICESDDHAWSTSRPREYSSWRLFGDCLLGLSFGASTTTYGSDSQVMGYPNRSDLPAAIEGAEVVLDGSNGSLFGKLQGFGLCAPGSVVCPIRTPENPTIDEGTPEQFSITRADGTLPPGVKQFALIAKCEADACPASPPLVFRKLHLTIRDDDAPTLSYQPADPQDFEKPGDYVKLTPGGWHRGRKIPIIFEAEDPSQALAALEVWLPNLHDRQRLISSCWNDDHGYRKASACQFSTQGFEYGYPPVITIDAARLNDGPQVLRLTVIDAAGNQSDPAVIAFNVDKLPPPTLAGATVAGQNAGGWIYSESAKISWLPEGERYPTATSSGLAAISWRVQSAVGAGPVVLSSGGFIEVSPGTSSLAPIELPNGKWKVVVNLRDAAGNYSGATNVMVSVDRTLFDAPTVMSPEWIGGPNSEEVKWIAPANGNASFSGLCGYSRLVNRQPDSDPGTEIDIDSSDKDMEILESLRSGEYWMHLRAVTCSGMGGRVEHTRIGVDRELPSVVLAERTGSGGWVVEKDGVELKAFDTLSGVRQIRYAIDGGPWRTIDGDRGVVELPSGRHSLTYIAEDRSGNRSDAKTTNIAFDPTPPTAALGMVDTSNPAHVEAEITDADSGIAIAWLEYRGPVSDNEAHWQPLGSPARPSAINDRRAMPDGVFPDAELKPGSYQLRTIAVDRAGHVSFGEFRIDGSKATLSAPMRERSGMRVGFIAVANAKRCADKRLKCSKRMIEYQTTQFVRYGAHTRIAGVISTHSGDPVSRARVKLYRLEPTKYLRRLIGQTTADEFGRFKYRLPPGASQLLLVRFVGSAALLPAEANLKLATRSRVSLHVSSRRGGGSSVLSFSGRVGASLATIPAVGKLVIIQFRANGKWITFPTSTIRAYDDGSYRASVAMRVRQPTRYRFRAFVPVENGWPFATGVSAARVKVLRP